VTIQSGVVAVRKKKYIATATVLSAPASPDNETLPRPAATKK